MNIGMPHIRFPSLFTFILVGLFAIVRPAYAAPTPEQMEASADKMRSRAHDMTQFATSLTGQDFYSAMDVANVAEDYKSKATHIGDLLLVRSIIKSEGDKAKIDPIISKRIKNVAAEIDSAVESVNADMASLNNQAAILTASKLRDDLRELKKLLTK